MRVGTVFKWNSYPFPVDNKVKPRWFIYLGKSGVFLKPIFLYICTTTTQFHHFQSSGRKVNHSYIKFKAGMYGFEQDCILDLDYIVTTIDESHFNNNPDIDIKGEVPEDILKRIYKMVRGSQYINKKIKGEIYDSFNKHGICGLKKP